MEGGRVGSDRRERAFKGEGRCVFGRNWRNAEVSCAPRGRAVAHLGRALDVILLDRLCGGGSGVERSGQRRGRGTGRQAGAKGSAAEGQGGRGQRVCTLTRSVCASMLLSLASARRNSMQLRYTCGREEGRPRCNGQPRPLERLPASLFATKGSGQRSLASTAGVPLSTVLLRNKRSER